MLLWPHSAAGPPAITFIFHLRRKGRQSLTIVLYLALQGLVRKKVSIEGGRAHLLVPNPLSISIFKGDENRFIWVHFKVPRKWVFCTKSEEESGLQTTASWLKVEWPHLWLLLQLSDTILSFPSLLPNVCAYSEKTEIIFLSLFTVIFNSSVHSGIPLKSPFVNGCAGHLTVTVDVIPWYQLNCFQAIHIIHELRKKRITTHASVGIKAIK